MRRRTSSHEGLKSIIVKNVFGYQLSSGFNPDVTCNDYCWSFLSIFINVSWEGIRAVTKDWSRSLSRMCSDTNYHQDYDSICQLSQYVSPSFDPHRFSLLWSRSLSSRSIFNIHHHGHHYHHHHHHVHQWPTSPLSPPLQHHQHIPHLHHGHHHHDYLSVSFIGDPRDLNLLPPHREA